MLLAGKYVQMAVYRAVVTPVAERALQRLRGALFGAIRTACHLVTTAAMVFEQCATEGPELVPEVVIAAHPWKLCAGLGSFSSS